MQQPKLLEIKALAGFKLYLRYETGEEKIFDVGPYIEGSWYGELADEDYFKTVHIVGTEISWANGQDLAPHELYELSKPYKE